MYTNNRSFASQPSELFMKTLIINIIGPDRPGIVSQVSTLLHQHQGNWLGSSLSRLAGQFAGIIEVQLPDKQQDALSQSLTQLSQLHVHVVDATSEEALTNEPLLLRVTANDRPGIIDEVSRVLHQSGANVLHLESWCATAPNWGSPLFVAEVELALAEGSDHEQLRHQLEQLADDLVVDFDLSPDQD